MAKYYRKIADAIAHSQRVRSNPGIFRERGDDWSPTQRELREEPRCDALRKRLLTPSEYAKAYGHLAEPKTCPIVDKNKFNAEKRARAKFNASDGMIGRTRDNNKLSRAVRKAQIRRGAKSLREIATKDRLYIKDSAHYANMGHFVRETVKMTDEERREAREAHIAWKLPKLLVYIVTMSKLLEEKRITLSC